MVQFPAKVQSAFGELAQVLHNSEQVDDGMSQTLQRLAAGDPISVDDLVGSFPLLAAETIKHVEATNDKRVAAAWRAIASEIVEERFNLSTTRNHKVFRE